MKREIRLLRVGKKALDVRSSAGYSHANKRILKHCIFFDQMVPALKQVSMDDEYRLPGAVAELIRAQKERIDRKRHGY